MAKRQVIEVIDDIDGEVLAEYETVRFSLEGRTYEFDTSPAHATEFRKGLQKYLDVSRPVTRTAHRLVTTQNRDQTRAIRNWANSKGYKVSDRGRIPLHIQQAFHDAH